ncbi:MAG: hypothetical protein M3Y71_08500, partial [Actinomycetota bacterium]|nr:hypothetical protein [Actinomycetota bacterium]
MSPTDDDLRQIAGGPDGAVDDDTKASDVSDGAGAPGAREGQAATGLVPTRPVLVRDAVRGWQRTLADVGGPNTLLWYHDLPLGTLDLTTAHPGGVSKLLAGRPTTVSDLVRERSSVEQARARARSIAATCD